MKSSVVVVVIVIHSITTAATQSVIFSESTNAGRYSVNLPDSSQQHRLVAP